MINSPSALNIGIFASGINCTVSNVQFKNIYINGLENIGVLFGELTFSSISNLIFEKITLLARDKAGWCVGTLKNSYVTNIFVISSTSNATNSSFALDLGIKKKFKK